MAKTVGIGIQEFGKIIEKNCFYVDKTSFIKEWWESEDDVTLITRPRRFGKTLNMSMLEHFFSIQYADRGDLFDGLSIWEEEKYRKLQGIYPVISLSFANVKEKDYKTASYRIIYTAIMGKKSSFFWMNMILLCRKHMWEDFGRSLLPLPEVCLTRLLRLIHIWRGD